MKRLVIVPPMFLPVPAVQGGAVEELVTQLIKGNERTPRYQIDVLSVPDARLNNILFKNTNIIQVKKTGICRIIAKIINHILYLFGKKNVLLFPEQLFILFWLLRNRRDIVLVENDMVSCYWIAKLRLKSKLIYHMHNDLDGSSKTPDLIRNIIDKLDCYLVISNYLQKVVESCVSSAKRRVLYNAIDIARFSNSSLQGRLDTRKSLGLEESETVFMYSGRITEYS